MFDFLSAVVSVIIIRVFDIVFFRADIFLHQTPQVVAARQDNGEKHTRRLNLCIISKAGYPWPRYRLVLLSLSTDHNL